MAENVEAIHSAVAMPVDDILNDAVNVMERYIGHDPDVVERLQNILRNARDIKQVIQQVGQQMYAPARRIPSRCRMHSGRSCAACRCWSSMPTKAVRKLPHTPCSAGYGCVIETAQRTPARRSTWSAAWPPALLRLHHHRRHPPAGHVGIRVDTVKLQGILDCVPMVLMTGFGYDPGHSIVKARQAGLRADAVLYKPFRLDALLDTVEKVSNSSRMVRQG